MAAERFTEWFNNHRQGSGFRRRRAAVAPLAESKMSATRSSIDIMPPGEWTTYRYVL